MSGGSFDYDCFKISGFADQLKHKIEVNGSEEKDPFGDLIGRHYSDETVKDLECCYKVIRCAGLLAREVEWLYSDDHGEESFRRLISQIIEEGEEGK